MIKNKYLQTPAITRVIWKSSPTHPEKIIIMNNDSQQFVLEPMGRDIFERCNGRTPVGKILSYLNEKYQQKSSAGIEKETFDFLCMMQQQKALVIDWDPF